MARVIASPAGRCGRPETTITVAATAATSQALVIATSIVRCTGKPTNKGTSRGLAAAVVTVIGSITIEGITGGTIRMIVGETRMIAGATMITKIPTITAKSRTQMES